MSWNLQTWLWGTFIASIVFSMILQNRVQSLFRNTSDKEPKYVTEMRDDKVRRAHGLKDSCYCLATFCFITILLFVP